MPKYNDSGTNNQTLNPVLPTALYPGDDKYVWGLSYNPAVGPTPGQIQTPNDSNVLPEAVATGDASIAVNLVSRLGGSAPGVIVQITTESNPGASEFDIQDSAVDADGAYITPNTNPNYKITTWTNNGAYWTANVEFQPEGGRFMRLKCVTNANGGTFQAKVSYV